MPTTMLLLKQAFFKPDVVSARRFERLGRIGVVIFNWAVPGLLVFFVLSFQFSFSTVDSK